MFSIAFSTEELIRYSQQIKLEQIGLAGQEKLKSARVLCIGLGGLGSPLLLYLAAAGVGKLGIIDDDVVELSNLHRQILYRQAQIASPKAAAAKEQLQALNPSIGVHSYPIRLTQKNAVELIEQYDIVADGSDNFCTRYLAHDICFALDRPYVYGSTAQFQGQCAVFHGKQGPCFRCLFPTPANIEEAPDCHTGGVLGVLPGLLGVIQASEIIKWVLQTGESLKERLLRVDLLKMKFQEIQLVKNPECSLCG
jgi:sulfur-carrier protein adenylyltransferase/sulfurtransferase